MDEQVKGDTALDYDAGTVSARIEQHIYKVSYEGAQLLRDCPPARSPWGEYLSSVITFAEEIQSRHIGRDNNPKKYPAELFLADDCTQRARTGLAYLETKDFEGVISAVAAIGNATTKYTDEVAQAIPRKKPPPKKDGRGAHWKDKKDARERLVAKAIESELKSNPKEFENGRGRIVGAKLADKINDCRFLHGMMDADDPPRDAILGLVNAYLKKQGGVHLKKIA